MRAHELERRLGEPLREQAKTTTDDDREHHEPVLVDEVVLDQRVHQRATPRDEDRATFLVPESLHLRQGRRR